MKTKEEILKETAEFYNSTNRGYDIEEDKCCYYSLNENMCAVGRCLENAQTFPYVNGVEYIPYEHLEKHLKPEYRGHSKEFWEDIQFFHDDNLNWNENGITTHGKNNMEFILNKIRSNGYSGGYLI